MVASNLGGQEMYNRRLLCASSEVRSSRICNGLRLTYHPWSVVAATITHLEWLKIISGGQDATFDLWLPTLAVQVIQNLSIITACIPYLKPFLESLETGMLGSDDHRRHRLSAAYPDTNETVTSSESVSLKHSLAKIFRGSPKVSKTSTPISLQIAAGSPQQRVAVWAGDSNNDVSPWDAESQGSQAKIIRQTRTWTVEWHSATVWSWMARNTSRLQLHVYYRLEQTGRGVAELECSLIVFHAKCGVQNNHAVYCSMVRTM